MVNVADVRRRHPNCVLLRMKRRENCTLRPLRRSHFVVPRTLTVGDLMILIRRRLALSPDRALFLLIAGRMVACSQLIAHLDTEENREDGVLTAYFTDENAFG